jgi:hypothetical protein
MDKLQRLSCELEDILNILEQRNRVLKEQLSIMGCAASLSPVAPEKSAKSTATMSALSEEVQCYFTDAVVTHLILSHRLRH